MDTQTDVTLGFSQNMPAKRAKTYSSSRRVSSRTKKPRTNYARRIWPNRSLGNGPAWDPFPAKATAVMRYSTTLSLDPALGLTAPHLFRANSIYDPDFTGVGHQPYGHDTYASIYNHYNVRQSTITMTPTNGKDGIYGISLTDDSVVQGDYDTVRETKGTKMSVGNTGERSTVVQTFNVNKNFDIAYQKATSANFGASPSEGMVFHCWFEGPISTDEQSAGEFLITITYTVDMWELRDLGQS